MTTLSAAQKTASRKPARVVVLTPTDFAADWSQRPADDVALGLRRLCDRDIQIAKAEASKFVKQAYGTDDGVAYVRYPNLQNPRSSRMCHNFKTTSCVGNSLILYAYRARTKVLCSSESTPSSDGGDLLGLHSAVVPPSCPVSARLQKHSSAPLASVPCHNQKPGHAIQQQLTPPGTA